MWALDRKLRRANHSFIFLILLLISMSGITRDSNAMAGLFGEYVLFSEVSGQIVNKGEPVANATITQSVTIGGSNTMTQTTKSTNDGSFTFPAMTRKKGLLSLMPAQFAAGQNMNISVDGNNYEGWTYTKLNADTNAESDGQPLRMVCDIAEAPDFTGQSYGICKLVQ